MFPVTNLISMFSKHFGQSFTSGGRLPTNEAQLGILIRMPLMLCTRSHLIMHPTIGLTDYYRTTSDGLTG